MVTVNEERLVRQFVELVQVDSPSLEEAPFVRALERELQEMGLKAENDQTGRKGAGNIFAVVPGTDSSMIPILISAHMDTVEPGRGIQPQIRDGQIVSGGTTILGADNKAAIAASLEAIRWLKAAQPAHGDVEFLFTWGEERSHQGAKAFDFSRARAKMGFVPDGEGPIGTIITQAPFYDSIRAAFLGRAAHAGIEPEKGISAIVMAARAIPRMGLGRIDPETTANLGLITGGSARNTVPERVEMEGEARSLDRARLGKQVGKMQRAMKAAARELGGRVEVEVRHEYDGFCFQGEEPVVRAAMAACRAIGLQPVVTPTCGGSDGNELNAAGIPTVVLGTGGNDFHSSMERIAVSELVRLAELIAALIVVEKA
jgi:tripeptide aminopeptidase